MISSIEDDLGREIALFLAIKGINLILFVRDENEDVKKFLNLLSTKFDIEVLTVNTKMLDRCSEQVQNNIKSDDQNERSTDKRIESDNKSNVSKSDQDVFNNIMKKDVGILINCSDYKPKRLSKFLSYSDTVSTYLSSR